MCFIYFSFFLDLLHFLDLLCFLDVRSYWRGTLLLWLGALLRLTVLRFTVLLRLTVLRLSVLLRLTVLKLSVLLKLTVDLRPTVLPGFNVLLRPTVLRLTGFPWLTALLRLAALSRLAVLLKLTFFFFFFTIFEKSLFQSHFFSLPCNHQVLFILYSTYILSGEHLKAIMALFYYVVTVIYICEKFSISL